ncbi:MAG: ribonuclease III [Chlamydiales bacterium]|nr:ribonuclease III [Chlamydiales bacterium]
MQPNEPPLEKKRCSSMLTGMNLHDELAKEVPAIETKIGYVFQDKSLLTLAFIHRSFINESREFVQEHNERLEFLGDSVLGLLVAEYLYRYLPETPEGELSYLRSRLVEASSCVLYVQKLDLGSYLLLGKGERMNDGRGRESILADLFEAVIGAVYIDGGIEAARRFLFKNYSTEMQQILSRPVRNWKALLQDHTQKKYQQTPYYLVIHESGPDHSKIFEIAVLVNEKEWGRGVGPSKKEAQQAAAEDAIGRLKLDEIKEQSHGNET